MKLSVVMLAIAVAVVFLSSSAVLCYIYDTMPDTIEYTARRNLSGFLAFISVALGTCMPVVIIMVATERNK